MVLFTRGRARVRSLARRCRTPHAACDHRRAPCRLRERETVRMVRWPRKPSQTNARLDRPSRGEVAERSKHLGGAWGEGRVDTQCQRGCRQERCGVSVRRIGFCKAGSSTMAGENILVTPSRNTRSRWIIASPARERVASNRSHSAGHPQREDAPGAAVWLPTAEPKGENRSRELARCAGRRRSAARPAALHHAPKGTIATLRGTSSSAARISLPHKSRNACALRTRPAGRAGYRTRGIPPVKGRGAPHQTANRTSARRRLFSSGMIVGLLATSAPPP
jgi:hypothetical protein